MCIADFMPCLWACLACVGFGIVYNIHGFGILICGSGAALGWFVFLLMQHWLGGDAVPAFIAAAVIAVYAESMARIRRCPVTGYLQIALLPLVPGAGIYNMMDAALRGDTQDFLTTGLHTLSIAGSLAVGVLVVSSLVRMQNMLQHRRRSKGGGEP